MSITPYSGTWERPQRLHLLRRTLFGVSKADIAAFANSSMNEMVTALLTVPTAAPQPPLVDYTITQPSTDVAGMPWVYNGTENDINNGGRLLSLQGWWSGLILQQDRNIREKMTLFWHNHVPTDIFTTVPQSMFCYKYNTLIRQHCLGNFKTLMRQMTIDPAMLYYLSGRSNTKTVPNENYARELQELFCIGKDITPSFTEGDVQAAAQVLTGWEIDLPNLSSKFTLSRHTTTDKVFSSFYNNTVIKGRNDANAGLTELDDLLTMLFAHPEVARYVVRKIYRFFVDYVIDPTIEAEVIVPLADLFRASNYEVKPVMQALFTSQHFYDLSKTNNCMIKSPIDHNYGFARVFGVTWHTDIPSLYVDYRFFLYESDKQGQRLGNPPDVSGWPAYYQTPNFHELWISADVLRKRKEFCDRLLSIGSSGLKVDVLAFTKTLDNPAAPVALIDEALSLLHPLPSDQSLKTTLKSILLSNQSSDYYWSTAWNNYTSAPTNTSYVAIVTTRLQTLYQAITNMAEFHLS